MKLFFKDKSNESLISWDYLIEDINDTLSYNPYCKSADFYIVFKHIILSLLLDKEIILLDSDFTDSELINLVGRSNFNSFKEPINKDKFLLLNNYDDLIKRLRSLPKNWKITLFTSGTTGIPKKISHDFKKITRFVKVSSQNNKNIWGYAYNPTHMAGVQVFFQAILNGNLIIRLFGLPPEDIFNEIRNEKITHISATPTFYRLLLPCTGKYESIKRITSGGEKFNKNTFDQLSKIFSKAKITNVYASTEVGALFASQNEIFSIKKNYGHLVKIENNELLIHYSLMGDAESIIGEWYKTGDIIEVISKKPFRFRFVSRKNDMINVGGYKVNRIEVEDALLNLDDVINARVYSKSNSVIGNIICCEVIPVNNRITEFSLRKSLQKTIQEFKIPRIIKFVNEISMTRTGKIKRN